MAQCLWNPMVKANTQMAIIIKERTDKPSLRLLIYPVKSRSGYTLSYEKLVCALKRMKNILEINMKDKHLRAIPP